MLFKKVVMLAVAAKPDHAGKLERGLQPYGCGCSWGHELALTPALSSTGTIQLEKSSPSPRPSPPGRGRSSVSSASNSPLGALALALAAGLIALAGTGCSTVSQPASASFAAVTIHGHTDVEIANATIRVLQDDGYLGGAAPGLNMTFQKEGSRMQSLAYEGLVNSHEGAVTLNRLKTEIVPLSSDGYRLQCQAYMVRSAGDRVFEEEQRVANIRSGPYQSLLNKVAKEL